MKNKKSLIIAGVVLIIIVLVSIITYQILTDDEKLTSSEKKWINNNIHTVQTISVVNNINILGNTGTGVFYDFLHDLETEYQLQINPVTFSYGDVVHGLVLGVKTNLSDADTIFYTDHYVLVGKNKASIFSYQDYVGKKIGLTKNDISYVTPYLNTGVTLTSYEDEATLLEAFSAGEDIDYMIVPLTIYLDEILKNHYVINHHLSDVKLYYVISGDNSTFASILKKYYLNWESEHLDEYFKRAEFNLFTTSLGISETEVDAMRSITYHYGFVNNSPYEVLMSGNYGGIVAMYLSEFSQFSNVEFNYTKYSNLNKLEKAINKNELDLYFNYYGLQDSYHEIDSMIPLEYSILINRKNSAVYSSLNSLAGETVYVLENSYLNTYLNSINGVHIETYKNANELKKINKKDVILVVDRNVYQLYAKDVLSNYTERYHDALSLTYDFKSKNSSAFFTMLSKYIMTLSHDEMINKGMYHHSLTVKTGNVLGTIAKYILIAIAAFGVIFILFYRNSKKIKVSKKIKRENKIKYIDQLTSIKNRNYLNEYINNWNNNTVYPQTMIVLDLNNIQFINDTLGYEEGDKQIRAAANILVKTQVDNSEIMRTDGNEFLIYLVGYTQKQVTNYIHKLNKEFKKLPYEYGAEFGYSMITDSVKTIEDAILEATDEMKQSKKKQKDEEHAG